MLPAPTATANNNGANAANEANPVNPPANPLPENNANVAANPPYKPPLFGLRVSTKACTYTIGLLYFSLTLFRYLQF